MADGGGGTADTVVAAVRHAKTTPTARALVGVGLASRAIVYGSLAVLVVDFATTRRPRDTDQGSALAYLGDSVAGSVVLVLLIFGVVCYSLWRWSEAIAGRADGDRSTGNRVLAVIEGFTYVPFAYFAVSILAGDPARAHQGRQYRTLSGRVLQSGWGQILITLVGLTLAGVGLFFVYQGTRRTFADQFDFPRHHPQVRRIVLGLGTLGSVSRGLIFVESGALVVYAALTRDPNDAGGFDSALDALARQRLGTVLLLVAATGFAAFALFAIAESIWRER